MEEKTKKEWDLEEAQPQLKKTQWETRLHSTNTRFQIKFILH